MESPGKIEPPEIHKYHYFVYICYSEVKYRAIFNISLLNVSNPLHFLDMKCNRRAHIPCSSILSSSEHVTDIPCAFTCPGYVYNISTHPDPENPHSVCVHVPGDSISMLLLIFLTSTSQDIQLTFIYLPLTLHIHCTL